VNEHRHESGSGRQAEKSAFPALLIALLALIGWFSFQAIQLFEERNALADSHQAQEQQMQNASKMRASLDAMASETARLAQQGNASARTLIDELRKRGVTINPKDKAASPALADK
jgi:uncharacterized membrane protein